MDEVKRVIPEGNEKERKRKSKRERERKEEIVHASRNTKH